MIDTREDLDRVIFRVQQLLSDGYRDAPYHTRIALAVGDLRILFSATKAAEARIAELQEAAGLLAKAANTEKARAEAAASEIERLREAARNLVSAVKHLSAVEDGIWVKMSDGEMELKRAAWSVVENAMDRTSQALEGPTHEG